MATHKEYTKTEEVSQEILVAMLAQPSLTAELAKAVNKGDEEAIDEHCEWLAFAAVRMASHMAESANSLVPEEMEVAHG